MNYRILVIDDEYMDRKPYYDQLVNEAPNKNLVIVDELRLDKIALEAERCHIAIVDIVLSPDEDPLILNDVHIIDF